MQGFMKQPIEMSSIQGLPARGSETSIVITRVHIHPLCELVEFWAKFNQEGAADYLSLLKIIQSPGNLFKEFEGNPGDQCLALKDGVWYRARIVSRNGPQHVVYLIDKGITYSTITTMLAWGRKEYFHLPPEVEFCVLANVVSVSPDNRWSPVALEFLKSLTGRSVKAHVQEIVMLHRMFVLHIPCIAQQMYEMGFARKLPTEMFQDFLFPPLQDKSGPTLPQEPQSVVSLGMGERLSKKEMFMYPELQAGTVETVVVTEVTNPQRIFCQLKVFSQELKKLSEQLTQSCDGRTTTCTVAPEMIGFPCAARGSDGKWYRSILQQMFPANKVVEVLNVDYGIKQIVQVENVRPLASEYFKMPVVTYNCSLHGIIDKGVGWTTAQIDYLRTLLLFKTIIAKFEYQSITEGVYYVTLYGDENSNINSLFGSKESCLLQCEKTLGDYAIRTSGHSRNSTSAKQKKMGATEENKKRLNSLPVDHLSVKSTYVAFVQYVSSPSEFWIQTQNFANELDALMDKLANLYQKDLNDDMVKNPTVGLYCAAKAEDGEYYRAVVTQVGNSEVKVHFVDYGNCEAVENRFIKTLPDEFKKLPLLALKCSLANVRPKAGEWSQEACELFSKTVMDRTLDVHVVTKSDDCHFVKVTDPEAQGEKDLAKLLCATGFAEKDETRGHLMVKTSSQFAPSMAQYSGTSFQPQNNVSGGSEQKLVTFKEQMFSIGSVLDVNVSYIESPNDFWCQLVQSAGHLKLLMYDMQTHYRNSEFQPLTETACVARHQENGLWYRALIVHKHSTPHVDVLFIDYGHTETVNILDLRKIEKEFMTLPGQAFRCSLFNPVDPTSAINDWTEEAVDRFHTFVETAANNFVILKCTIYAVMYSEQKIVFNIVNLETPFESICTNLVNLVKSAPPSGPSFRLDTYYYSTHNVKTGTEEQVTVTNVKNVSHFYCQLRRNADVLRDLQLKVNILCEQLLTVKIPPVFGTLCFARYTDGHWYRGQIKATKPSVLVHFVDYGDTIEVDKDDLLPVPKEASDIMAVPVQAVLCSLSDIPDNVPSEVNSWFETSSTECDFRALIVAKETDGKLVVELYQGKGQVNTKIKKLFELEIKTEEPKAKSSEPTVKPISKESLAEAKHSTYNNSFVLKSQMTKQNESVSKKMHPQTRPRQNVKGNLQLYRPPQQRESNGQTSNGTQKYKGSAHAKENVRPKYTELTKQKDRNPEIQTKPNEQDSKQHTPGPSTESWIDDSSVPQPKIEKLPKLVDLPSKSITSGMVADVYISHYNSPLSFYVQLVKEENDILSIVEKLNDTKTSSESDTITELLPGDLVQAEFSDDSSWYRAVVKEKQDKATVLVEFVDFGNTATVPVSKMRKLDKTFLRLPAYSTHCLLKSAAGLEKVLDTEVLSAFESAIDNVGEKLLQCKFIQQSGTVWKVSLQDNGVEIDCKPTSVKNQSDSTLSQVKELPFKAKAAESCSLRFKQQEFQDGQQLEVYISSITDAQSFWCQSADTGELEQISESVAKAGNSADPKNIDSLSVGSPCIALFSEDQLWHRAELLNRIGDEVSLLFVDYGNTSQVKIGDLREIPPQLIQTPLQAFLCELEGFDSSEGSWESSAADMFSALTVDQLLQLTVSKVTKEDGKTKCYVHLECEGLVINESMREFWKSKGSEVLKESETSIETEPLSELETVQLEEPKKEQSCEVSATLDQSLSEVIEELIEEQTDTETGSLDFETSESLVEVDENLILADDTQVSLENSGVSFVVPLEQDENQMCSTSSGSQILESLDINISAITPEPPDASTYDMAMEETLLYCTSDESEDLSSSYEARLMDQDLEEQDLLVLDTTGPEDMGSPLDECFLEAMDESSFTETPFESPYKEAGDDPDTCKFSAQNQNPDIPSVKTWPPIVKRAARLVPCLALTLRGKISPEQETPDEPSLGSLQVEMKLQLQNEDLSLVPSKDLPQDLFYQDMETSETVIPETPGSVSMTAAQMVPCLSFHLTSNTGPEQESPDESQQNQDVFPSSLVSSQNPLDSDRDTQTPENVSQMSCSSGTSDILTEDFSFLPSRDTLPQDSSEPDLVQSFETSEVAVPEMHASVTLVKMNEDLLLPSNDVTPCDTFGLNQDSETPEEIIHEPTYASVSPVQTCALLLPWSIALPDDSFDSDQERETPEVDTAPHSVTSDKMNQELLFLASSDILPQDSIEQELGSKADDVLRSTSKDETPDFRTDLSSEPLVYCEETFQDLFGAGDVAATESQTCSAPPTEKGDRTEEAVHLTEVSFLDLCTDEKSQIKNLSEASSEHFSVTEEETVNKSPPRVGVPCGQLIVLDDVETGAESESCSFTSSPHSPEAVLTEQTSCVVEEACTSDLYAGEELAAEEESSESEDSLKQMEESSDDTLTEEYSADDSLEAQLSKVTHLSLIVEDGSVLEHPPEE
ncbi:tudor domain-containing 6 [Boleophthalmus pectinirostris]|uniref:tudor domain-containing 6 n=1 Tax=Boleophthalmus pectinirostris TaxID=150288 RepID=UPI00242CA745|nr:tudor domain-containing 6 [Boleophthalmus pectinirostris]XP_055005164.1 tudor domain-containing 6 [Boleophthalmus pectinirostris]XP_055005165.1 tudor domain-containing 6 [Boleophthalmus pectinirostris]